MSAITFVTATLYRILADDSVVVVLAIHKVFAEYGFTAGKGYTVADPNLNELFQVYSQPGTAYWVAEQNGGVVDGGDVAPLGRSEPDIYKLQKMYFLLSMRGQGLAKELASMALEHVREQGLK